MKPKGRSRHPSSTHEPKRAEGQSFRSERSSQIDESSTNRIYGLIPVLEALRAGRRNVEHISIADGVSSNRLHELLELARHARVPVRRVPRIEIERGVGNITHQGVVARIAAARYADAEELLEQLGHGVGTQRAPLAVGLDGLEDPRNFGSILRTAECSGVDAVFTTERRAVGLTETVAKTAAGALEYVPVARVTNMPRLIEQLKERNIWVVGTAADAARQYTEWDWALPTTVLLGGEGAGLRRLVRERCDALVRIPVVGRLESLNVGVAAGVVLYEALRQRDLKKLVQ